MLLKQKIVGNNNNSGAPTNETDNGNAIFKTQSKIINFKLLIDKFAGADVKCSSTGVTIKVYQHVLY